jgi:hypothetical protein
VERDGVSSTGEVTEFWIRRDGFQRGSWHSHGPLPQTPRHLFWSLTSCRWLSVILIGDTTSAGKARRRACSIGPSHALR